MSQTHKTVRAMVRVSHQMTQMSAAKVSQMSTNLANNILGYSTLDNAPLTTASVPLPGASGLELKPARCDAPGCVMPNIGFGSYHDTPQPVSCVDGTDVIGYWVTDTTEPEKSGPAPGNMAGNEVPAERFDLPPLPSKRWEQEQPAVASKVLQQAILVAKS